MVVASGDISSLAHADPRVLKRTGGSGGRTLHTFSVPSLPQVTRRWPSGRKATSQTSFKCPLRIPSNCHPCVCHNLTVRSLLAVASVVPSGENDNAVSHEACATKLVTLFAGRTSQI